MASRVEAEAEAMVEEGEVEEGVTTDVEAEVIRQIATATARRRERASCRIVGMRRLGEEGKRS